MSALSKPQEQQLFIPSALLAWVFPGLGYFHRGEMLRGLFVMLSVGTLILVGVMVGGIQVCDPSYNPVTGMVQRGSLPGVILHLVAANTRPAQVMSFDGGGDAAVTLDRTGGKPEEIGLIFTAVAGFLNLMAVIGSLTPLPREPAKEQADSPQEILARAIDAGVIKVEPPGESK